MWTICALYMRKLLYLKELAHAKKNNKIPSVQL